uniref:Uncharacterized protein LOC100378065 n=1 Tax=Saccoglossus kowalevskii TaxID=10224 RepID=A0ABM0GN84_SACKO|nr:PREDICTED: uncharacterized protein LOC100378065 [Saccoglossus kowalevskii]
MATWRLNILIWCMAFNSDVFVVYGILSRGPREQMDTRMSAQSEKQFILNETDRHADIGSTFSNIEKINSRLNLYQGDIMLTDEQQRRKEAGLPIMYDRKRGITSYTDVYWSDNTVHYWFDENYDGNRIYAENYRCITGVAR